ncbi:uncharacterized protein LOC112512939 [Cynara cardunculus var. scolymus]|uniref:uncharacterized protein LOC112512939 n=1 Tax=Cynara cardunculus var. scolymus TaxID=59895 RepID=UPI000D625E53|nr:uncharacterized protein LOC112512939 [Cynara cardunculus var. scolymus]
MVILKRLYYKNAPKNNQLTSLEIQKDLVTCFAEEVLKSIIGEIGDDVFALLVDESCDVSRKEQMAMVLRFVDKVGVVQERFVGVVHTMDTSALSLKSALDALFAKHGFSQRGQGYEGTSNMSGKFNGLKALILSDNNSSFYIHFFAHQLQLVLVAVAKKYDDIKDFFDLLALVVTVVNSSCKRKDMLRESHKERIQEEIGNNEIDTEDIKVLEYVEDDGDNRDSWLQARGLTNSLSQALQRKDEDILEAVTNVRENGFDQVVEKCYSFYDKHKIVKLDIAEAYVNTRNPRKRMNINTQHYYNYDIFNTILDMQIREFGDRFGEINTDLLQNMAALNPHNSFSQFNKSSLLKLS